MTTIRNTSTTRTIIHEDEGMIYRIDPLAVSKIPDEIAECIISGWTEAVELENESAPKAVEPWEYKCGQAWELAKQAMAPVVITKTIGPLRTPVVEPELPADAIDVDSGRVLPDKTNTHVCPTCEQAFNTLQGCRLHQRKVHKT